MLIKRSLFYYWRTNLAVIAGVAIAVTVLAGALVVGESVRASLRDLVLQRLGRTDDVVFSTGFFRERLADELKAHRAFSDSFDAACPLIVLDGFVSDQITGRRASGVQIYGVDDRFWRFHGRQAMSPPETAEALLSEGLAQALGTGEGGSILLRVETRPAIPVESLHGRKEDLGQTLRLSVRKILPAIDLGEFSLRPQQGAVRAVFVPLGRLQSALERQGRVNTILISRRDGAENAQDASRQLVERLVRDTARLEDLGLTLRALTDHRSLSLESDSTAISDALATSARATAAEQGMAATAVLSYLANAIRLDDRRIPYSVVTALDLNAISVPESRIPKLADGIGRQAEAAESRPPIILNDWAARNLGARLGSTVSLDYYVWKEEGRLETRSAAFQVAGIVPIEGPAADRDLTPNYPGITNSDRLSDWDPPFPIDLSQVRPVDEEYWRQYRTTPKAFVPLETGQQLWKTRYGSLTSLRLRVEGDRGLEEGLASYGKALRLALDPLLMGFSVRAVRAEDLAASRGATDFGAYFTYFSTFLVLSALLLAALFFKLGVEQRLQEIGLLQAVGFDENRIRVQFFSEAMVLSVIGSVLGVAGALGYGALMMTGLRTWWIDAVGTRALTLHVTPLSLILGAMACQLAALACLWWTLRSLRALSARELLVGAGLLSALKPRAAAVPSAPSARGSPSSIVAGGCAVVGLLLLAATSANLIDRVAGFFGAGALLLVASLFFVSSRLRQAKHSLVAGHGWWPVFELGLRNTICRPGRSLLCIALVASATFVIVAVEAFKRDDTQVSLDRRSGTGGYMLLAESLLPIVRDLDSRQGRDGLNLPTGAGGGLEGVTFSRFRLRPGDDTSCLNLYQPSNPRILAPTPDFVRQGRFSFQSSAAETAAEHANPWLLLNRQFSDGAIPVVADANSMTYVLHLQLGEDLVLAGAADRPLRLRLVGALADSIFQGELLMSEDNFVRLFPSQEGYRFLLIDVPADRMRAVSDLLDTRLADFGIDVSPTRERLAAFHRVEYTYLSTFQTLGGLGVLLGTFGLGAVLLRNVLERRRELAVLRVVGYEPLHLCAMVVAETLLLLVAGLAIGTLSALLAVAPVFLQRGGRLPVESLSLLLTSVLAAGLLASLAATAAALRSPTLPALRVE
ncbi:MAG TPA: ABC transporter permease [Vicinamibacterales bacterium]|jgi:ABC-type lipoprotein release transport system permease subunit|nr:ABC transporter permease [Vicinamibacterales bacterium]